MALLLIASYQYHENYGSAGQPRWKAKGGEDIVLATLSVEAATVSAQTGKLAAMAKGLAAQHEWSDDGSEQYMIDWELLDERELVAVTDAELDRNFMAYDYHGPIVMADGTRLYRVTRSKAA